MKLAIESNVAALRERLQEFSDRRFNAAMATALSRSAVKVRDQIKAYMPQVLERPTPYTLNSLFAKTATADRLEASVDFKDDRAVTNGGTPATYYLMPQVEGGQRKTKRLEVALQAVGALPRGWFVVPGAGATVDAYGNVSRGQIVQVLSQLRIQLLAGSSRNMSFNRGKSISAQRRAGGRYFVQPVGGAATPGIYQREFLGRNVVPVFLFVKRAQYQRRFDFYRQARDCVTTVLPIEVNTAIADQLARLKAARP